MASSEIIEEENEDVFSFDKITIGPENDDGNSEYKLQLTDMDVEKVNKRGILLLSTKLSYSNIYNINYHL